MEENGKSIYIGKLCTRQKQHAANRRDEDHRPQRDQGSKIEKIFCHSDIDSDDSDILYIDAQVSLLAFYIFDI